MKLAIVRYYDLRSKQEEKVETARSGSLTMFVNKAHTIAHGIVVAEPDMIIRLRIPGWLKGTSDRYAKSYFEKRLHYLLETKIKHSTPPKPIANQFRTSRLFKNWERKHLR